MFVCVLALAALISLAIVQRDYTYVGLLVLLVVVAAALMVCGVEMGTLVVWVVASGLAYPFARIPQDHPYVTFDRVWIPICAAALIIGAKKVAWAKESRALAVALVIFGAAFLVRAILGIRDVGPIEIWLDSILLPTILFLIASRLATTAGSAHQLATAIVLGGVIVSLIGIAESAMGFELASRSGSEARFDPLLGVTRISGPYPVPEVFALILLICLAVTIYRMQTVRSGIAAGAFAGAAVLEVIAIALTYFRAAWLGAALVLVVGFAYRPGRLGRTLLAVVAVGIGLLALLSPIEQIPNLGERLTGAVATGNIWGRLATDMQSFQLALAAPIFGVGVNRYMDVALQSAPQSFQGVAAVPFAHNSYLNVLVEQGLVGFGLFLAVTFRGWRAIRRLSRQADRDAVLLGVAASGAGLAFLVMSLTLTLLPYGPSNGFVAILLGMVCGRLNGGDREVQDPA